MGANTKKTTRSMRGMNYSMAAAGAAAKRFGFAIVAAFGVQSIKRAVEFADNIAKISSAVGLTAEQFQEFRHAAEIAGVATSQFESNMIAFVKRVGEARGGMGPLVSGLKNLNPALLESLTSSRSQAEAFKILVTAMDNATTATEKAAIANAAFSRAGVTMSNLTIKGMRDAADAAREMGLVLSDTTTRKAEILQDRLTELTAYIRTKFITVLVDAGAAIATMFGADFTDQALTAQIDAIVISMKQVSHQIKLVEDRQAAGGWLNTFGSDEELERLRGRLTDLGGELSSMTRLMNSKASNDVKQFAESLEYVSLTAKKTKGPLELYQDKLVEMGEAMRRLHDPTIAFDESLEMLDDMLRRGIISIVLYNQEAERLAGTLGDFPEIEMNFDQGGAIESLEKMGGLMSDLSEAGNHFVEGFATGLADSLLEGGKNFKDFAASMLKDLARMILRATIFNALMSAFGSFKDARIQGSVDDLLGSADIFALTPVPAGITPFGPTGAPRATVGVLQAPTYGYGGGGGMGGTVVNITNNAPVEVETTERRTGRGLEIDILIERSVQKAIVGGGLDKALTSSFSGIRRAAF
ncbi:MAG: hypothetical protein JRJ85_24185, partial [Deltaproteobacteria bacterium]|nr:hypothetical protein [Deltaproteobacteria bacterium]